MEDYYVMWLTRLGIEGFGRKKMYNLLNYFETAQNIWNADKKAILGSKIVNEYIAENICSHKNKQIIEKYIYDLGKKDIRFISINNKDYPELLKKIDDPPLGLYIRGKFPDEKFPKINIIGARRCSTYGATMAYKFAKELAAKNIVIVSGMARGIDSKAHIGALDGNGYTIAVLGCGVDICYPPENIELMKKIIDRGCVLSEYPPGTKASPNNFPQRNRIISGLCEATFVIEAAKRSGTLITVQQALDNGRTVFTMPGNITSKLSEGTNELIKEGCPIVTCVEDIIFELNIKCEIEKYEPEISDSLDDDEKSVYNIISLEPVDIEFISETVSISVQDLQYILTVLELKNYIQKLPGDKYIRAL